MKFQKARAAGLTSSLWLPRPIPVAVQRLITYPSKEKNPQLQQANTTHCQAWTTKNTDVEPVVLAQLVSTQPGVRKPHVSARRDRSEQARSLAGTRHRRQEICAPSGIMIS
ncbi:hypothetical protein [Paraburkholderia domus]|uniref:hypothetical protein n=1 Tax=Paraburkholderia domus TaxID=2793075 RepID=UPI001913617D|nr:hypothetical protein [Paraburkholderia domus]MBK5164362.1 hypothetical protein [Burkholderia sp. R-70211]